MTDDLNPVQYPNGKLNVEDEGVAEMAIGVDDGRVVIAFRKPMKWIALTPDQAGELANRLIRHARSAGLKRPLTIEL